MPTNLTSLLQSKSPKNGKYFLIAIDGRGGAGKTTLAKYIESLLPGYSFICGDDYFEPLEHPIAWGGYNDERFTNEVIQPLQQGVRELTYKPFVWDDDPHYDSRTINISKGVFIDRCYSFSFELDYDLKIWVETPRGTTLDRGIERSTMPKEKAEKVWRELWKPMEDKYIAEMNPVQTADISLDGTKDFTAQLVA